MGLSTPERFILDRRIANAYVIYDFHYHESHAEIHEWLRSRGVFSIGRYGDWNYSSMEDALIDGHGLLDSSEVAHNDESIAEDNGAKVSVVIPVYNEEGILSASLSDLLEN